MLGRQTATLALAGVLIGVVGACADATNDAGDASLANDTAVAEPAMFRTCTLDQYPDFARCDLAGADLSGMDWSDAAFSGANLRGADLSSAILWLADFTDADLTGANLSGAQFRATRFSNTVCPDGTNSGVLGSDAGLGEPPFCEPLASDVEG